MNVAADFPSWKLRDHSVQLTHGDFSAVLDLRRLECGLHHWRLPAEVEAHSLALGRGVSQGDWPATRAPADYYLRQRSLSATFAPAGGMAWRVHADWILVPPPEGALRVVDLVISLQTDLLEAYPEINCSTQLDRSQARIWRRLDSGGAVWEAVEAQARDDDQPCQAVSWGDVGEHGAAYLEMAYPGDFDAPLLETASRPEQSRALRCRWRYGGHFQEKGVIRRLRLRAIWLDGPAEPQRLAQCWADFLSQPLPLAT